MNDSQGYKFRGENVYWLGAAGIRDFTVVQNYNTIKNECAKSGKLFEDPEFPPTATWLRPKDLCTNPTFITDKSARFDFKQGDINDTWFMAALASLTVHPNNLFRVVCLDNKFGADYCGVFHFRFWQNDKWVDVVIDDRLPIDRSKKLIKLSSKDENEFWPALLEKAYAKLYGGYIQVRVGDAHEGFEDFMGSPTEVFDLKSPNKDLYEILQESLDKTSLIGCGIKNKAYGNEVVTTEGIIQNRAYIVTKAREIELDLPFHDINVKIQLVRLRNPWGQTEWTGPWSDGSIEWLITSIEERKKFGIQIDHDGEFWMSFEDFLMRFDQVYICTNRIPSEQVIGTSDGFLKCTEFNGEWINGKTAGGCFMNKETFHTNPQFLITLETPNKNDPKGRCSLFLSLTQKNRRSRAGTKDYIGLGYAIYKLEQHQLNQVPMGERFLRFTQPADYTPTFSNPRGITGRHNLEPGHYLIIPSSFNKDEEAEFLLRAYYGTLKKEIPDKADEKEDEKEEIPDENKGTTESNGIADPAVKTSDEPEKIDNPEWDDVEKLFKNAAGKDETIDWIELKKILDTTIPQEIFESGLYSDFKTEGFSKETCRSIVAIADESYSKTLTLDEFRKFYKEYLTWKEAFKTYDTDKNHVIGQIELQDALEAAGYVLNPELINMLVYRYANDNNEMLFGDFILCALKVKQSTESFKRKVKGKDEFATFQTDYTIQQALYC